MVSITERQQLLAAMAAVGGVIGILVALENLVLGFLITGGVISAVLIDVLFDLKDLISPRVPDTDFTDIDKRLTIGLGGLVLVSFIPAFLPELVLIAGVATFLYFVVFLWTVYTDGGELNEKEMMHGLQVVGIGALFVLAAEVQVLLVLPIVGTMALFVWELVPDKTKDTIYDLVGLDG